MILAGAVAGCASAGGASPERLRISARDAANEARTVAAGWAEGATLRYVEGESVTTEGHVAPGAGAWRLVYEAPGRADQLVVTVTPRTLGQEARPRRSPPGFVLGDAALGADWVDSPAALAAVRGAEVAALAEVAAVSVLLAPLRPPQWIVRAAVAGDVREWRVNASTGQVIPR